VTCREVCCPSELRALLTLGLEKGVEGVIDTSN
jgi:hypothetical protein